MSEMTTTVEYISNIQPVKTDVIMDDQQFLSHIHDPFALEVLKKQLDWRQHSYSLSKIQQKEMDAASGHCAFAFKDDYPWGTVVIEGRQTVVCKCLNKKCGLFYKCRSGVSALTEEEKIVLGESAVDENETQKIFDSESSLNSYQQEGSLFKADITKELINAPYALVPIVESPEEDDFQKEAVVELQEDTLEDVVSEEESALVEYDFTGSAFDKFVSVEQNTIIQCSIDERLVVNAGPGTGKTYTLIQKLITFLKDPEIDPEEILILCFSRAAVEVIKSRLYEAYENGFVDMRWNLIDIRTFDSFATHMLAYLQKEDPSMLTDGFSLEHLDYSGRISAAKNTIMKYPEIMEGCAHLIVDEVQDLVSVRAELVIAMIQALPESSGITLLGDACQSIYDYQVKDYEMDSKRFYRWMFNNLHEAKFFSLSINYRQTSNLEDITNEYREAILSEQKSKCQEVAKEISNKIQVDERIDLKDLSPDIINQVFGTGSIGILTRTNGQALKVSTWLRSNMIPHRIQRPLTDRNLNIWIAEIFCNYPSDTVNKAEFMEYTCNLLSVSEDQSEDYWDALESTLRLTKDRYTVEELLNGIYTNARNSLLFTEENNTRITVSNIHRSKGREFEHVILLDDGIYAEGKDKDIDEHKVSYVSVSRAKQTILKTSVGKHYIRSFKSGSRRSFEISARRGKKPALSRIEVGKVDDLSNEFFAESAEVQKLVSTLQLRGQAVEFKRNHFVTNYVGYDLIMADSEEVLGKTDEFFSRELIEILRNTLGLYGNAMPRFYPDALDDIYLDQKITVIGRWKPSLIGARRFGNLAIWEGLTVIGFAHPNYNRY